ncbi:ferrous iron transport protein A [Micromonospora sp. Llam0]|uniref:ferrous iron transport protein A n=1 Tax=Micromonospora sp. Llam0 TaxID=2485143 RepID=UPI000F48CCED|nr:ferrous iron transport protein A [Micromonospora sp. Llam0]
MTRDQNSQPSRGRPATPHRPGVHIKPAGQTQDQLRLRGIDRKLGLLQADEVVTVRRLTEGAQRDPVLLQRLHAAKIIPGARVTATSDDHGVLITRSRVTIRLTRKLASLVYVSPT